MIEKRLLLKKIKRLMRHVSLEDSRRIIATLLESFYCYSRTQIEQQVPYILRLKIKRDSAGLISISKFFFRFVV